MTRAGGASNGTTPLSWQIVTNATTRWAIPSTSRIGAWNPTTGANVTVTICGLANAAALPNDDDIWIRRIRRSGTHQRAHFLTSTKANILAAAAAVAADTSTWNRASAHVDATRLCPRSAIAVGSNAGQVFYLHDRRRLPPAPCRLATRARWTAAA